MLDMSLVWTLIHKKYIVNHVCSLILGFVFSRRQDYRSIYLQYIIIEIFLSTKWFCFFFKVLVYISYNIDYVTEIICTLYGIDLVQSADHIFHIHIELCLIRFLLPLQLPANMRGGNGKVAYIDTEGTLYPYSFSCLS